MKESCAKREIDAKEVTTPNSATKKRGSDILLRVRRNGEDVSDCFCYSGDLWVRRLSAAWRAMWRFGARFDEDGNLEREVWLDCIRPGARSSSVLQIFCPR